MTPSEKEQIRKIQAVLLSIDSGTPKFFNVAQYEKMGLVVSKTKWGTDLKGNKTDKGHTFHLTEKAKRYLNLAI